MMEGLRARTIHSQQPMTIRNVRGKGREQEHHNLMEIVDSRAPFGNLTNQSNGGAGSAPNPKPATNDNKHRKRERDRARYAAMSRAEKNARNLRQREARQKKKGAKYFLFVVLQMDYM
ncbi:hypothetical protein PVAP13_3KG127295 [Panicum virgatum]|uniref:Uncharacterized protein n=1 Tax=Panicum virgatum TaxID=38727 RepID=A0A8T0UXD5_PANVG|nr:hypothetical protein PVAP13_3KG127295 [Panicum virgatum]KAG2627510.1 hypothetical protein PVAP13_3KG127295 [Panicum virgatum]